jgi:hypothetical protein
VCSVCSVVDFKLTHPVATTGIADWRNISYVAVPRWLLLAHQLPTRSSNARVKTWRRLQQIGAVPTRNSVYVLPNTEQCREDFEWIRSEIVALGGEATVFAADALNREGSDDIVTMFQRTRDADYRAVEREADKLRTSSRRKRTPTSPRREASSRNVRALRERFSEIGRIDFFHTPAGQDAAEALAKLDRATTAEKPPPAPRGLPRLLAGDFRNRRWVTRPRPGVDRMASAWLIRRLISPKAAFRFRDHPQKGETPFDMYVGDFSHQGSFCTFETLAQRFDLSDPAVVRIGQIVHDLDMKENRYATPEAPAIGRMVHGLQQLHADDQVLLQRGIEMFEALANSFGSTNTTERGPRASKVNRKRSIRVTNKRRKTSR